MKKSALFLVMSLMLAFITGGLVQGQYENRLGLPGDNLNLFAVMKLFQESETLEGFEKALNEKDLTINNLDLDGDNRVDYLRVVDYVDGEDHTIVLQVALNAYENQDVAVFTVDRDRSGNVAVQLIGDEDLYGKDYIVEPYYNDQGETPNPAYVGNANQTQYVVNRVTTVEVAAWPLVRFMYTPNYMVWRSPWYYGYYPVYWQPWHPHYYHYYYGYHSNLNSYYYGYYHHWNHYRYERYHDFYYKNHYSHAPMVRDRIKSNSYQKTYSRPDLVSDGSNRYQQSHREVVNSSDGHRQAGSNLSRSSGNRSTVTTVNSRSTTTVRTSTNSGNGSRSTTPATSRKSGSTTNAGRSTASQNPNNSGRTTTAVSSGNQGRSTSVGNRANSSNRSDNSGVKRSDKSNSPSGASVSSRSGSNANRSGAAASSGRKSSNSSGVSSKNRSSNKESSSNQSKSNSGRKSNRKSTER